MGGGWRDGSGWVEDGGMVAGWLEDGGMVAGWLVNGGMGGRWRDGLQQCGPTSSTPWAKSALNSKSRAKT